MARVRSILFGSFVVCALGGGAFLLFGRESSNATINPQRVATSQAASVVLDDAVPSSSAESPGSQSPEESRREEQPPVSAVTDEQIEATFVAHPELRASIEELLNDPDPEVRQQAAAMV